MDEKIKVDKNFIMQIATAITNLTARMDKYDKEIKSEQMMGFALNCNSTYLGDRDLVKEKQFSGELQKLMIQFKMISVKADLVKKF